MEIIVKESVIRVVTVAPDDRIDTFNAPQLRSQLYELLESDSTHLVLDLSQVPFIDSAGLSVLVSALKRSRLAGGDLKVVWPEEEGARRIFHLTKLDRVFDMYDNAADAIRAF